MQLGEYTPFLSLVQPNNESIIESDSTGDGYRDNGMPGKGAVLPEKAKEQNQLHRVWGKCFRLLERYIRPCRGILRHIEIRV